ncbi:MAG: hypothetical protein ACKOAV_03300, partial [Bacteroidota bacterium]
NACKGEQDGGIADRHQLSKDKTVKWGIEYSCNLEILGQFVGLPSICALNLRHVDGRPTHCPKISKLQEHSIPHFTILSLLN